MAQVIGKVNELDGSFFVRNAEGKISVLNEGDTLYDGDVILGSGSNSNSNFAKVLLADNSKTINVFGDSQQLFDETMLTSELSSETVVLDDELNESLLLEAVDETLVPEDGQEQATLTLEEIENLSEAAAGEETAENTEVLTARLENRTGGEVDVNTSLRDSSTFGGGLLVDDPEAEVIEDELANPSISIAATKSTAYESSFFFSRQVESEEELDNLEFTVSQDVVSTLDVLVNINLNLGEAEVEDFAFIQYTNSTGTLITLSSQTDIQDFVDNGATISIPAGSTTAPLITLFVKNDTIYEISEELSMSITSPVNGILGVTEAFGTIFDDTDGNESDKPIVSIDATTDTAKEGETTGVVFTVSQTNESNFDTEVDFTVTMNELELADIASISYTDSTGTTAVTDIADFIANGVTLKIGANTTDTPTVTIVPVDDDIHEVMENFAGNIALSAGETDAILGTSTDTAKFVDEGETNEGDKPTVSIEATIDTAKEGETTGVVFTVSQTNESNFDTEVDFTVTMNELELADIASISYTDSTGTTVVTDIADFITNGVTLKIGANTTDAPTVTMVPVDDDIHEVMENFAGNIALSAGETDAILGTSTDTAKFVDEGDTNEGDKPTVSIVATIDTATEGEYLYSNKGSFSEESYDEQESYGELESVLFTISQDNESNFDTSVDFTLGDLEIEAADILSITYTDSTGSTTLTNPTDISNFVLNGVTLTIGANTTDTPTVKLTPVDDDIYEREETFTGNIALSAGETDVMLGVSSDEARFIDEDDKEGDKPTVKIVATDDLAVEGLANDTIVFEISQDNVSNFETKVVAKLDLDEVELADIASITYTDAGGTATVLTAGQITSLTDGTGLEVLIPVGSSGKPSFTITAVDDDIYEQSEEFGMNISGAVNADLGVSSDTAAIEDEDDKEGDKPTVKIVATDDLAVEGLANDTIVFEISQDNVSNFETKVVAKLDLDEVELADIASITYTDAGGTATVLTAGQITSLTDGTGLEVLIPVGSSGKPSFTITAVDDDIYEQSEEFGMNISGAVNADLGVSSDTAAIEDEDDKEGDKPTVKIVATDDLAVEGLANDTIVFEISQDNVSNFETKVVAKLDLDEVELADIASITYTDAGGTATVLTAGQITSLTDGTGLEVLIPVGSSGKPSFTITAVDDDIYEQSEEFGMNISGAVNADLGVSSDTAAIEDEDDKEGDKPTVKIVATDDLAVEGLANDTIVFEISQDNVSNFETKVVAKLDLDEVELADIASITYTDAGGTATVLTAGQITSLTDGTGLEVLIPVGSSGKPSFTITAVDDDIYEQSEEFGMNISGAVNADLGVSSDTAAIEDEDDKEGDKPTVKIVATDDLAVEGLANDTIVFEISQDNVSNFETKVVAKLDLDEVELADIASITYTDAGGTATVLTAGQITSLTDGTGLEVLIPVGSSGKPSFTITAVDDDIYEQSEEFGMNISGAVNADLGVSSDTAAIEDEDDKEGDKPTVKIVATDDLAVEGLANDTIVFEISQDNVSNFETKVVAKLDLDEVELADIASITYTDAGGTATVLTAGQITSLTDGTGLEVLIPVGSSGKPSFTITAVDDDIYEQSEEFGMNISGAVNADLGVSSDTAAIEDEDDKEGDKPTVKIVATDDLAVEGLANDTIVFEISQDNVSNFETKVVAKLDLDEVELADIASITYTDAGGTATVLTAGQITSLTDGTGLEVLIPVGSSGKPSFTITAVDDDIYEQSEEFGMNISGAVNADLGVSSDTAAIEDEDDKEGDKPTVKIVATDDLAVEGLANDTIVFEISQDNVSNFETKVVAKLDLDEVELADIASITYTDAGGTATVLTAGQITSLTDGTGLEVLIPVGSSGKPSFTITAVDDDIYEQSEEFGMNISGAVNADLGVSSDTAAIEDEDDKEGDKPTVKIVATDDLAVEGLANDTIVFEISQDNVSNFETKVVAKLDLDEVELADIASITYTDAGGTATVLTAGQITSLTDGTGLEVLIPVGSSGKPSFTITAVDDDIYEQSEEFGMNISGAVNADLGVSSDTAAIEDEDDKEGDKPTVKIVATDDLAVEGLANDTIVFEISQDNVSNFETKVVAKLDLDEVELADIASITYTDAGGTATVLTAGQITSLTDGTGLEVLIPVGSSGKPSFTITAVDDDIYEQSEEFGMNISGAVNADLGVSSDTAAIEDEDDKEGDKPTVKIVATDDLAVEGLANDTIVFEISQDNVSNFETKVVAKLDLDEVELADIASITYTDAGGTATVLTAGQITSLTDGTGLEVLIPVGSSGKPSFTITAVDDDIYEQSEEFGMNISGAVNADLGVSSDTAAIEDEDDKEGDKPTVKIVATDDLAVEGLANDTIVFEISQDNVSNFETKVVAKLDLDEVELADIASITYTDAGGTATVLTAGQITSLTDGTGLEVLIPVGSSGKPSFTITAVDDDIYEQSEEFGMNISGAVNADLGVSSDTAAIEDEDDKEGDKPTVKIVATDDLAVEGLANDTIVFEISQDNVSNFETKVVAKLDLDEVELADIASITYTDAGGTATVLTAGQITSLTDGTGLEVLIPVGSSGKPSFTITAVDDDIYEQSEEFGMNISGAVNADLGVSSDTAAIEDEDDKEGDKPTVKIVATDDLAVEGLANDTIVFEISQDNVSNFETKVVAKLDLDEVELADIASITYTDAGGTATVLTAGQITSLTDGTGLEVLIPVGSSGKPSFTITAVDDDIYEQSEEFGMNISGAVNADLGVSSDTAAIEDEDDKEGDKPTVKIVATDDLAVEGLANDTIVFEISQDNVSNFETKVVAKLDLDEVELADIASITYTDAGGTATVLTAGQITSLTDGTGLEVLIPVGSSGKPSFTITAVDDDIYEQSEEFGMNISGAVNADLGVSSDTAAIEDEDDKEGDKPTVKIVATDDLAVEGLANDTIVFEISQDNVSNFETKVVAKLDLDEVELADIASITYTDAGGTATVLTAGQITSLTDGTGLEVLIPVGSSGKPSFTITAVDDDIYEQSEEFGMNISGAVNADLGVSSDTAAIEDEDDKEGDKPTVKIVATDDLAVEGLANDTIVFEISQDNVSNFETKVVAKLDLDEVELADIASITYTDAGGTATVLTAGQITSLTDGTGLEVLIPVGSSGKPSFTITAVDDDIYEQSEEFGMNISGAVNADLGVSSDTAAIEDEDDKEGDKPTVKIVATDDLAVEGLANDTIVFEISQDNVSNFETKVVAKLDLDEVELADIASITYTDAGGTATVLTAGQITSLTDGTGLEVLIPVGSSGKPSFTISVYDDNVSEDSESLSMNISGVMNATLGVSSDTATIIDDEGKPSLTINDKTVDEDAGTMTFTVTLSGQADSNVTFTYATSDGTAEAGSDYTAVGGTGTIIAGATTTTIVVPILNDNVYENTESFNMNLSAPSTNATIADGIGIGTILDDEAKPSLTINDKTVDEDAGTMTFTVTLSGQADSNVTFTYATSDGTAEAGSDYTAVGGTGTIIAGATTTTIVVPILNDNVYENTESFNMNLSAPSSNATISDGLGIGTILDDQTIPVVSINATDDLAIEGSVGNTTLEFSVSQDKLSEFDTTVKLDLTLGTVEVEDIDTITYTDSSGTIVVLNSTSEISDFVSNGDTLKIEAGNLNAPSIVITVAQDNIYEASEVLTMEISNPSNAILGTNSDTGTIQDINTLPTSVDEEQTLIFDFNGSSTTNIVLILDTSGSMGNSAGNGHTRLSLAKEALENLITAYDNIGDVNVQLVEFAGSATSINFTSGDAAIAAINALIDGGSTNYEEAIESAIDNTTFTPSTDPSVNTLGFFITDGSPTSESDDPDSDLLSPSFVSDWDTFINTTLQVDQLNVIGIGTNINNSYLNELKVTSDPVVIVTDPNDLDATLQDTIVDGSVSGNALDNIDFNYNGAGQIDSIEIDGTSYDRTDIPLGSPVGTPLEITTPEGATLKFYFDSGNYDYEANSSNFMADVSEVITVYASDANGDITNFDITINVDVDVIASPAILDVSLGNETAIPVPGEVIDVTNNFNSNLEGWTGDISRSSNEMEIESGSNSQATKTFYFDTDYVGHPLTISFDTDIDTNGGSKWDSGTDEFVVEINGTEVYSEKDSSDLNEETHTLTNVFLKPDGSLDVKFIVHSGGNSEWVEIDDFNIVGIFAPTTNTYKYDMTINAGLLDNDGSEVLSDKVILDNLPSGITLKDSNNDVIVANGDGTYSVEIDVNGDATATLISDTQLANGDIDDITASIDTTELHGNATETVTVNVKAEIDGTASAETINGTAADELIDGKAGADTIDAGLGDDTLVFDPNDIKLDGGSNSSSDNDTLLLEGNDGIDFSTLDNSVLKNIDTLNLREGDHNIEKLSLQDVIDMTDSADKTLRITGDSSDNVELKDGTGAWTSSSTQEIDTVTYDVYTNSEDSSYKVLVQQEITDTVI